MANEDVVRFSRARDEEQGSFSGRDNQRTYDHMDNSAAQDREENAMRNGANAVGTGDGSLPSDSDSSTRWNVTSSQVDDQMHEYPTRSNPGR
jgi:hypothetical protein